MSIPYAPDTQRLIQAEIKKLDILELDEDALSIEEIDAILATVQRLRSNLPLVKIVGLSALDLELIADVLYAEHIIMRSEADPFWGAVPEQHFILVQADRATVTACLEEHRARDGRIGGGALYQFNYFYLAA